MAKRKITNLLGVAILSLLKERPMHPYELSVVMRQRKLSLVIKLNQSSLYSVIEALEREGWIVPVEVQREGRYPERTVYTTTEVGKSELDEWVRELISRPEAEYSQFVAGLAFLGNLPPTEVAALLEAHARTLHQQASDMRALLTQAEQLRLDRLFLVEDLYTATLLETKLAFVQQLIQEINDGTLTEMREDQRIWKISDFTLPLDMEGEADA